MKVFLIVLALWNLSIVTVIKFSGDSQSSIFWGLVAVVMAIVSLHYKDN